MPLTLLQLKDRVYHRLGDEGYSEDPPAPSKATLLAAVEQINDAVADVVNEARRVGVTLLRDSARIFITPDNTPQVLTITATGGTFTLTYFGVKTSALAHDISSANLLAALDAIKPFGDISGTVVAVSGDGPHTCTWSDPGSRANVPLLTVDPTLLTGGTASIATTSDGTYPREYNVDYYCHDGSGNPNYRTGMTLFRTDTDRPLPVQWIRDADWRMRESPPRTFTGDVFPARWPDEYEGADLVVTGNYGRGPRLYTRYPYLGFETRPTSALELTIYYEPHPAKLVDDDDVVGADEKASIVALGLTVLESEAEMIAQYAATMLKGDISSPSGVRGMQRYERLRAGFLARIADSFRPVTTRHKRRWAN